MCDMKPFGELSDIEKGALLLAHHEGKRIERLGPVSNEWAAIGSYVFYDEIAYRIAPEPTVRPS